MVDELILPRRKRFGVIRSPETGERPIAAVTETDFSNLACYVEGTPVHDFIV